MKPWLWKEKRRPENPEKTMRDAPYVADIPLGLLGSNGL